MFIKKLLFFILPVLFLLMLGFISLAPAVSAADILPAPSGENNCPEGYDGNCGDYAVNDFLQVGINVTKWLFGIAGSVVLLFFIYGGFIFIFSGGSSSQVEKGKNIIIGSVIGLLIMFASYIIIQFAMTALGVKGGWQVSGWFASSTSELMQGK